MTEPNLRDASRRLIVSADDFGMSPGANEGVVRAHRDGILTETSLMVTGAAAEQAVAAALRTPALGVGLHLVLVQGKPALPGHCVPDLVNGEGMFLQDPIRAGLHFFFVERARAQIRREVVAQLDRFAASGLPLSHVDGHLTIHVHPVVLDLLAELSPRYGIRSVRLPLEPLRHTLAFDRSHLRRKLQEGVIFSILGRWARARLRRAGILHPDRMYGMHQTGYVSEAYLLHLIPRLRPGVTELYCHPAITDDEIRRWTPDYDRDGELAALTSPRVREALSRHGVVLARYRDLSAGGSGEG